MNIVHVYDDLPIALDEASPIELVDQLNEAMSISDDMLQALMQIAEKEEAEKRARDKARHQRVYDAIEAEKRESDANSRTDQH